MEPYVYKAVVERVIDGDTVQLSIDLGFDIKKSHKFRLKNVWAAERGEMNYGLHSSYTKQLLPVNTQIIVKTFKDASDKYGRYIGEIYIDKQNINESIQTLIGEKSGNI
jgi:micrococcal nuclease